LGGGEPSLELVGQERNEIMAVVAKMNLLLHGVGDYVIHVGDSLLNPRFGRADYVVANPPWNQDGYSESNLGDPSVRGIYTGFVSDGFPPKSSADWAWVQLMLYHAKRKVGIVLDQGALFRGGRERRIRRALVDGDFVEAVILLTKKLFYNTGAPGIVMVLNRDKPEERRGRVLFINASQEYEKHPEVRRLNRLGDGNIRRIVDAYRRLEDITGFARVVSLKEIKDNDYNLNVTLYVMPIEEEEPIDILKEFSELKQLEKERQLIDEKLEEYISQLTQVMGE